MLTLNVDGHSYTLVSLTNGAGLCKYEPEFANAVQSAAEEPTLGSITLLPRTGHTGGDVFYYDEATGNSVNALGLPNAGWEQYKVWLPDFVDMAKKAGKHMRLSIAGFSADDYFIIAEELLDFVLTDEDARRHVIAEFNYACPNTEHAVISYHTGLLHTITQGLLARIDGRMTTGFKYSPYNPEIPSDANVRRDICAFWNEELPSYRGKVELVNGNTIGGQEVFKPDGSPALGVNDNKGGLAGKAVRLLCLGNVAYFAEHLHADLCEKITLVGCGGITSAQDIINGLIATKKKFPFKAQMTSYPAHYGFKVFGDVFQELAPFLEAA